MGRDAGDLLREVLSGYADSDKWVGQPFEHIKRLSNTKVGDVGQDFVERLCGELGFTCEFPLNAKGKRSRTEAWDVRIEGTTFELKTATEDVHDSFQFNHIRYHRPYDALLCIGIAPSDILMDAWTKAAVVTGQAGPLVSMDKGSSATHKLTKRRPQLRPIDDFEDRLLAVLATPDAQSGI